MNKYLLAGVCLLACVAGGVAQLALHRSRGRAVKVERAVGSSFSPVPAAWARAADSRATPSAEARGAREETPVEAADEVVGLGRTSGETRRKAGHVGGISVRKARKAARREGGARGQTAQRPVAVRRNVGNTDGGGAIQRTAGGAKKTGKWLGRKLKKVGDVFHE